VTNTLEVPEISPGASVAENMAVAARRGVIEASIRVGAEASIGGAEIDQALVTSFKSAAVDAVGSVVASEIGRAARAGEIGKASHLIAHAALGCGKVDSGATAGRNAVENNNLSVVGAVYVVYAGDGNPVQGLINIGEGRDPISKAAEAAGTFVTIAAESAADWVATNAPAGVTEFIVTARERVSGGLEATLTYVDTSTGSVISRTWNATSEAVSSRWEA